MNENTPSPKEGRGRSAQKRAAQAVETLAEQLVALAEYELARLPLNDEVAAELRLARSTQGHSSRKRQIKHLAGLLRRDDAQREALADYYAGLQVAEARARQNFHRLEALRDRLGSAATAADALDEIRAAWPHADLARLASLARSVQASGDKKAAREIFRLLRKAAEQD